MSTIASPISQANSVLAAKPTQMNAIVGKAQPVAPEASTKKVDAVQQMQADKDARLQRLSQSLDTSQLNYSFDKQSSTLSVKVVNKQSGEFIRQLDFQGFEAMEVGTHGDKGRHVDHAA